MLVRARNTEREVRLRQIYLKFECGNPPLAFAQALDAM